MNNASPLPFRQVLVRRIKLNAYDLFVQCFETFNEGVCANGHNADFNLDGAVDFFDYDAFVQAFEGGCQ